jgi:hypothetical protein
MLVPSKTVQRPSLRGTDESTPLPGAVTSGLSWSESGVGPLEEKSAIVSGDWSRPLDDAATVIASGALAG